MSRTTTNGRKVKNYLFCGGKESWGGGWKEGYKSGNPGRTFGEGPLHLIGHRKPLGVIQAVGMSDKWRRHITGKIIVTGSL